MEFVIANPNKYIDSNIFTEENPKKELFFRDGEFYISGVESQEEADALIASHNPTPPPPLTVEQKLQRAGLSLDDLKQALGL